MLHRVPISLIRSKLFVPGSRPELFPKAMVSAADCVSFDLEDSVAEEGKVQARQAVAGFLRGTRVDKTVIVRVNGLDREWFAEDVAALEGCGVDLINVPKVESAADVRRALDRIPEGRPILANIETPRGLRLAAEIATADARVAGLQVGFVDLFSQCGISSGETAAKQTIRLAVRLAAAEAGISAFDSAFADIRNVEGFREEAESAKRLGFTGKSCIHPTQVALANEVFSPSAAEIARAEQILAAERECGSGVFRWKGQMIDKPVLDGLRAVLLRARGEK